MLEQRFENGEGEVVMLCEGAMSGKKNRNCKDPGARTYQKCWKRQEELSRSSVTVSKNSKR